MRTYTKGDAARAWVCGHWNGSPLEIGLADLIRELPEEAVHHHPYCEYYVGLEGSAELEVDGLGVTLEAGSVVMVEPGERHRVVAVGPDGGRWIVIKERSVPGSKEVD